MTMPAAQPFRASARVVDSLIPAYAARRRLRRTASTLRVIDAATPRLTCMVGRRMPSVLHLYAGRAGSLETSKGLVPSAIAKTPVSGRAAVAADGLAGDEQISPSHGGPDRALCVYPSEHYAYWHARVAPAFGENITSAGVLETEALIGEVWRIGTAVVQVTQPRSPCYKVAARLGIPDVVIRARRAGFTGMHLRVLEPGELAAGDTIEVVERPAHGITVTDAVRARFDPAPDPVLVARVLALRELAEEWREKTAPRLARAA
jgi:MOSC domain-containing protein YiiM